MCSEHPGPGALPIGFRARSDGDVVVELQVPDTQVTHDKVHRLVQVLHRGRVAQVQVVAGLLDHALAVAAEERLVGELRGDRAAHPDDLGLEP